MSDGNSMRMRKKGGLITFLGILLIFISIIISINILQMIIMAIFGLFLIFYGVYVWKKAMHEMLVRHVALHAGKIEFDSADTKEKPKPSASSIQKAPTIKCPSCDVSISKNAKFCPKCSAVMTATCPKCDYVISVIAKFCPKCETRVSVNGRKGQSIKVTCSDCGGRGVVRI